MWHVFRKLTQVIIAKDCKGELFNNLCKAALSHQNDLSLCEWSRLGINLPFNTKEGSAWVYMAESHSSMWKCFNIPVYFNIVELIKHPNVTVLDTNGTEVTCPFVKF